MLRTLNFLSQAGAGVPCVASVTGPGTAPGLLVYSFVLG